MAARRLRQERDYQRALSRVYHRWTEGQSTWTLENWIDIYERESIPIRKELEDRIFITLKERYEKRLKEGRANLQQIEESIWHDSKLDWVEDRLWSMLDVWERIYPSPKSELLTLVHDGQNVHTRLVTKQTDRSMAILNAQVVPSGQRTIDEILEVWLQGRSWSDCKVVYEDMLYWGKKATIYADGDYLYRQTLRSLWALIKTYKGEVYTGLVARLWEECNESVDVCAQGHITRLANVMVGFHDDFLTPQSHKEQFQDLMAEIARRTCSVEEKVAAARLLMVSHGMSEEEGAVWLDAL
jgi:hypothetical protein